MTKEEKEILLKDLCARLPYKVCAAQYYSAFESDFIIEGIVGEQIYAAYNLKVSMTYPVEKIKPYLRPMSSMTREEEREVRILWNEDFADKISLYHCYPKTIDFYNKHHFDYHGLIEKGLAIKAPNNMYKI